MSISASSYASTSPKCPGEDGYYFTNYKKRNPQQGGFVSNSADVNDDDDVFVAPTAAICGSASVSGNARIYGNAVIQGNAEISGDAKIYGDAVVEDDSSVKGDAKVYENARIGGSSLISGDARVKGWSKIYNKNISTGTEDAPQFTAQELHAQEMQRQALLQKELEKKERLEKNKELRDHLYSILENNLVIENSYTEKSESNKMILLDDPCTIKFKIHDYDSSYHYESLTKSFSLHHRTFYRKGVENNPDILKYENTKFKNEFLNNNLNSPYYFEKKSYSEYVVGQWRTVPDKTYTAVPLVYISNYEIKNGFFIDKVNESRLVPDSNKDAKYMSFMFANVNVRDDFYNTLDKLYNSCESAS